MSTGIEEIDAQHRSMVHLLNTLIGMLNTTSCQVTIAQVIDALRSYARQHFQCEEACMTRYRCPTATANRAAHGSFLEMADAFSGELATHGATQELALEMEKRLCGWVIEHIGSVDRALWFSVQGISELDRAKPMQSPT